MTVTQEQGAGRRVAVVVSSDENSGDGQGTGASIGDEDFAGRIAWDSGAMPNGDPSSITLWGTAEER